MGQFHGHLNVCGEIKKWADKAAHDQVKLGLSQDDRCFAKATQFGRINDQNACDHSRSGNAYADGSI
ncbi:MAG: hypothetical protein RL707_1914 [Pseudomonadota bacterium]